MFNIYDIYCKGYIVMAYKQSCILCSYSNTHFARENTLIGQGYYGTNFFEYHLDNDYYEIMEKGR